MARGTLAQGTGAWREPHDGGTHRRQAPATGPDSANPAAGHLLNQRVLKAPPGCVAIAGRAAAPARSCRRGPIRYAARTLCAELCRNAARKLT